MPRVSARAPPAPRACPRTPGSWAGTARPSRPPPPPSKSAAHEAVLSAADRVLRRRRSGRCRIAAAHGTPPAQARAASGRPRAAPTRSGFRDPRTARPPAPPPRRPPCRRTRPAGPGSSTSGRMCRRAVLTGAACLGEHDRVAAVVALVAAAGALRQQLEQVLLGLLARTSLTRSHPESLSRAIGRHAVAAEPAVHQLTHAVRGVDRVASTAAVVAVAPRAADEPVAARCRRTGSRLRSRRRGCRCRRRRTARRRPCRRDRRSLPSTPGRLRRRRPRRRRGATERQRAATSRTSSLSGSSGPQAPPYPTSGPPPSEIKSLPAPPQNLSCERRAEEPVGAQRCPCSSRKWPPPCAMAVVRPCRRAWPRRAVAHRTVAPSVPPCPSSPP